METSKSIIKINTNNVVKILKDKSVRRPKQWLMHYQELCKSNKFLVKVFDVDDAGDTVSMEKIDFLTTIEVLLKDHHYFHLVNKNILCDILYAINYSWAQSMEYSKYIREDQYFINTDVSLHNMVITKDKGIKILDPESYDLIDTIPNESWAFDFTEKYYMTQINLMGKIQKFNYVQI